MRIFSDPVQNLTRITGSELNLAVILATVCLVWVAAPIAAQDRVRFDALTVVGCSDVTTEDFAEVHPDERMIEAIFRVSTISDREEYAGMDLVYQFVSPNRTVQVVDYLPNTTMHSEYASNLAHSNSNEKTGTLGLTASVPLEEIVKLGLNANQGNKKISSIKFEKLPPMQILSASGTLNRGSAVYYKLKPSRQTTLEGSREYVLKLRVPISWRGDVIQLQCRARKFQKGSLFSEDSIRSMGSADFLIALYLDHDLEAKRWANELEDAEQQLRKLARQHRSKIDTQSSASTYGLVSYTSSQIPANWISRIIFDTTPRSLPRFVKLLPAEVRQAAFQFAIAKTKLQAAAR